MPAPVQATRSHPVEDPNKKTVPTSSKKWLGRTVVVIAVVAGVVALAYCLYELTIYAKEVASDKFSKETNQQLEEKARKKGLGNFVDKVKETTLNQRRVLRCLSSCKTHEVTILNQLNEQFIFTRNHFKEMLSGAHIRLNDKGATCEAWAKLAGVKNRISSHPSDGQQYAIRGALIKELLFSAISDQGKIYSWFQLENNPVSFGSAVRHMIDYVKYKISAANQGPYGSSPMTDLEPLCIELKVAP